MMLETLRKVAAADSDDKIKKIIVAQDNTLKSKKQGSSAFMAYVLDNITDYDGAELYDILLELNTVIPKVFTNLNTRNKYMSNIRQVIADKYGMESEQYTKANDLMKINKQEKKKLIEDYNVGLKEKGRKRKVFIVEDIIKMINESINKEHYADQAIGLLLVGGMRPLELLSKNTYEPAETDGWIRISNLGKKRAGKQGDIAVRPLIQMSPEEFIKRVTDLRELAKTQAKKVLSDDGSELSKSVANALNDHLRKYKSFEEESVSVLRKIYGNLSYELFANKLEYSLNTWLSDVLGHDKADIATASAYATVAVNAAGKEGNVRDIAAKLAEVKADNQVIKQDVNQLKNEVREHSEFIVRVPMEHYDVEKIPKRLGRSDAEIKDLLKSKMAEMHQKGIELTNMNVRKYAGIGAVIVNKYLKQLRGEVQQ